jgi:hypothetical protein
MEEGGTETFAIPLIIIDGPEVGVSRILYMQGDQIIMPMP